LPKIKYCSLYLFMARIKLNPPHQILFSIELKVRVSDINYGGHLGNDRLLALLQEARIGFFNALGFKGEKAITEEVGIIMSDAAIMYKSEAFLGEELKIGIDVEEIFSKGCDLKYQVDELKSGRLVAIAKTGIVFFNYSERKIANVPDIFLQRINHQT